MAGANNGTGQPLVFRCWCCRRKTYRTTEGGYLGDVRLTGRIRQRRHANHPRMGMLNVQYTCKTCGHVGWSHHVDIVRAARAWINRDQVQMFPPTETASA